MLTTPVIITALAQSANETIRNVELELHFLGCIRGENLDGRFATIEGTKLRIVIVITGMELRGSQCFTGTVQILRDTLPSVGTVHFSGMRHHHGPAA